MALAILLCALTEAAFDRRVIYSSNWAQVSKLLVPDGPPSTGLDTAARWVDHRHARCQGTQIPLIYCPAV